MTITNIAGRLEGAAKEADLPPHEKLSVIIPPQSYPAWINDSEMAKVAVHVVQTSNTLKIHQYVDLLIKQGMTNQFDSQLILKVKGMLAVASLKEYTSIFNGICDSSLEVSKIFTLMGLLKSEKHGFSKISLINFCLKFVELMFENPKLANEILNQNPIASLPLHDETIATAMSSQAALGFPIDCDESFSKCLANFSDKYLSRNKDFFVEPLTILQKTCIRHDTPFTFQVILTCLDQAKEFHANLLKNWFENVLYWDSVECFKVIYSKFKNKFDWNDVVLAKSSKCLTHILKVDADQKVSDQNLKTASDEGYAEFVLAGCRNNYSQTCQIVFFDLIQKIQAVEKSASQDKVFDEVTDQCVFRLMRFSAPDVVEKLFATFKTSLTIPQQKLATESYEKAKANFFRIAPFISQYARPSDVRSVLKNYSIVENASVAQTEQKFGAHYRKTVESLCASLKVNQLMHADASDFAKLPKSKKGSCKAALLLEAISKILIDKYKNRPEKEHFGRLRNIKFKTNVQGRYVWGSLLLNSVYYKSQAKDFARENYGDGNFYYKGKCVTRFESDRMTPVGMGLFKEHLTKWLHGRAALEHTWGDIEDLFEELMSLPQQTQTSDLIAFYKKAAKLIWLIGNTQPFGRGSGTVVEWFFAIVHLNQGLNPPVLRKKYPQLDVLNISHPLSDYEKPELFLRFFEPETLPQCLRHLVLA